jgi:hypothetical protein
MEQLTKKQEQALNQMVKTVSRKFPFILGWEPSKDFLIYDTMLNINFIIDYNKLSEFFGTEPTRYWADQIKEFGPYNMYGLGSMFDYEMYPHIKELSYNATETIERLLNNMNEQLPEDYVISYPYENFRGEIVNIPRKLRRDSYIFRAS